MQVVWKYTLPLTPGLWFEVKMPQGARALDVQRQGADVVAWALVEPDAPPQSMWLRWYMTGEDVREEVEHVATVQFGPIVLHLFERETQTNQETQ